MRRVLTISNVLAFEHREIPFSPGVTLVTGENSAGKTSVARVLAALVTHESNPVGLSAALTKAYLRHGAAEGSASLSDGAKWVLPNTMEVPAGVAPEANRHTAGIVDFIGAPGTPAAKRIEKYEALFLPNDPAALLKPLWDENEPQQLQTVLATIAEHGWQAAQALYIEQRRDSGRQWQAITARRYSKKQGPSWKPEGWSSELEGKSEDDVLSALADAQDALRAAGVRAAVEQDRVDRGVEARDVLVPRQQGAVTNLEHDFRKAQAALGDVREQIKDARYAMQAQTDWIAKEARSLSEAEASLASSEAPLTCPACGVGLEMAGGLKAWEAPVAETQDALRATAKQLQASIKKRKKRVKAIQESLADLESRASDLHKVAEDTGAEYNRAWGELDALKRTAEDATLVVTEGNASVRSVLEDARDRADEHRKAWLVHRRAMALHENYVEYDRIAALLAPSGARGQFMAGRMDRVRAALSSISKRTGWEPITISPTYEVMSGRIPAVLAAENERRKCQWAIQIALTMLDRSVKWVILDAADLLRGESWHGLQRLLDALAQKRPDLYIVVCATETESPEGWAVVDLSESVG